MANIRGLAEAGCWGFNFHDDDLVPFGSPAAEAQRILGQARAVMTEEGMAVGMATCNMFEQPVFRDGALTSNDARVWGGREGLEVEASKDPVEAIKRYREGVEFVAAYKSGLPLRRGGHQRDVLHRQAHGGSRLDRHAGLRCQALPL